MNSIKCQRSEIRELSNEEARQIKGGISPRNFVECLIRVLRAGIFGAVGVLSGTSVIRESPMNVLDERS